MKDSALIESTDYGHDAVIRFFDLDRADLYDLVRGLRSLGWTGQADTLFEDCEELGESTEATL